MVSTGGEGGKTRGALGSHLRGMEKTADITTASRKDEERSDRGHLFYWRETSPLSACTRNT